MKVDQKSLLPTDEKAARTRSQQVADSVQAPDYQAAETARALVSSSFSDGDSVDLPQLVRNLQQSSEKVARHGGLDDLQRMLTIQAQTLDMLFNTLTRRAVGNMREGYGEAAECYFKLGLRAQSQCRQAIEALHEAKSPRPVFIGQNNLAQNQQVNNSTQESPREEKSKSAKGTIEHEQSERMDSGAPGAAGGNDPELAAMEGKHWSPNRGGEGS